MSERFPIQKEFGEIQRAGNKIEIRKFGSDSISGSISLNKNILPTPHYAAYLLEVAKEDQGKGLASQLMSEVEKISRESGIPVLLGDGIDPDKNLDAMGMYARRPGWVQLRNANGELTTQYIYGSVDPETIDALLRHYIGGRMS